MRDVGPNARKLLGRLTREEAEKREGVEADAVHDYLREDELLRQLATVVEAVQGVDDLAESGDEYDRAALSAWDRFEELAEERAADVADEIADEYSGGESPEGQA